MTRVDVVVPCYNYGRYLRACVDSVLHQRDVNVRVLIIDDCSSDDTETIGMDIARTDARVTYRRHRANQGHIATYNEGLLEWAEGDYCLLLSADDMLAAGALARATALMNAHPEVGMVFGDAPKTERPEQLYQGHPDLREYVIHTHDGHSFFETMCREAWNMVPTPTAVVRTSLQKSIGGYRPELPHSGDMEMWLRCAAHAGVGVIDGVQAFYRIHGAQMSIEYEGIRDYEEVKAAFDSVLTRYAKRFTDTEAIRRKAYEGLAHRSLRNASKLFDAGLVDKCDAYVTFAFELHPALRNDPLWTRFKAKRLLGPRVWSMVRQVIRGLRRPQHSRQGTASLYA